MKFKFPEPSTITEVVGQISGQPLQHRVFVDDSGQPTSIPLQAGELLEVKGSDVLVDGVRKCSTQTFTRGRNPNRVPTEVEIQVRKDLQFSQFLFRFLAAREFSTLALEFKTSANTLRRAYNLQNAGLCLTPEEFRHLCLARKQHALLEPLRTQYSNLGIAARHRISANAVGRIRRDLLNNKPIVRAKAR